MRQARNRITRGRNVSSLSRGKIETLVDGRDPSTGDGAYRLNFILPFLNTYDLNLTFGYSFRRFLYFFSQEFANFLFSPPIFEDFQICKTFRKEFFFRYFLSFVLFEDFYIVKRLNEKLEKRFEKRLEFSKYFLS